jgi:UDP-glucose 4-epimerase
MINALNNKVLLITGGTGSFGNEVLKHYLKTDISEIRIFSRDEKKQDDIRQKYQSDKIKFYIGDVRNIDSLEGVMQGVDYVFHAAALKQVPSCEFFPVEAVRTNVLGADNVLTVAIRFGVKRVVVLSTDKAVYPINAMGISKALMEKVMIAKSRNVDPARQVFCGTRYGNVMCSRGSVIPLFIKQIKEKSPITITDGNMTRFMMSLPDAVHLVEYAFSHANPGDIFVQKAPACTIFDLALALRELFEGKNEIKVLGPRHGEKNDETLCNREEMFKAEDLGDYYRIPADNRDLNYTKYLETGYEEMKHVEEYNSANTIRYGVKEMKKLLLTVEYVRQELGII